MKIDILLTEAEELALSTVAVDTAEWIENFVRERIRLAADRIVTAEIQRRLDNGITVPASRDAIVVAAFTEGDAVSAADQHMAATAASAVIVGQPAEPA